MGIFDWLSRTIDCPACHKPGARQPMFGAPRCSDRNCIFYAPEMSRSGERGSAANSAIDSPRAGAGRERRRADGRDARAPTSSKMMVGPPGPSPTGENYHIALKNRVELRYRNFRGEPKVFHGDWRTLRRRGTYVSLRVEPTGRRIALAIDRIENYGDVKWALRRCPNGQEMRVLNFHARRGTTSSRCEELRRKYAEWIE